MRVGCLRVGLLLGRRESSTCSGDLEDTRGASLPLDGAGVLGEDSSVGDLEGVCRTQRVSLHLEEVSGGDSGVGRLEQVRGVDVALRLDGPGGEHVEVSASGSLLASSEVFFLRCGLSLDSCGIIRHAGCENWTLLERKVK